MNTKARRFDNADTAGRVRTAIPLARQIVMNGVDLENSDVGEPLLGRIEELLGYAPGRCLPGDKDWKNRYLPRVLLAFDAAYALRLAVGTLTRPEAFEKGGAR